MFSFFRRKPKAEPPLRGEAAPGTEIRYDPELIPELKQDHVELLAIYRQAMHAFDTHNYGQVSSLLERLRGQLQKHLLSEKVRLYIYLEHMLANDPERAMLMHDFRQEMDGIGRTAVTALRKYAAINRDPGLVKTFESDFQALGQVLVQRIKAEEDHLYTMYRKS